MNKNTITAFALMALVLFGFMAYQNHTMSIQQEEVRIQDSIDAVNANKAHKQQQAKADKVKEEKTDTLNPLYSARQGQPGTLTIENELLKVTLTNKGGQMQRVELKDSTYKSRESLRKCDFSG